MFSLPESKYETAIHAIRDLRKKKIRWKKIIIIRAKSCNMTTDIPIKRKVIPSSKNWHSSIPKVFTHFSLHHYYYCHFFQLANHETLQEHIKVHSEMNQYK